MHGMARFGVCARDQYLTRRTVFCNNIMAKFKMTLLVGANDVDYIRYLHI